MSRFALRVEHENALPLLGAASPPPRNDWPKHLLGTLGALLAARLGCCIPLPGLDPGAVQRLGAASASGGYEHLSLFALGLTPYLSAFVIVHMVVSLVPRLGALRRQGGSDGARIEHAVRLLAMALALVQAIGLAYALERVDGLVASPGPIFVIGAAASLAGGSFLLIWLADRISAQGVVNGVVAILAAGILANAPATVLVMLDLVRTGALPASAPAAYVLPMLTVIVLVTVLENARRPLGLAGGRPIALGLNPAGMLPPLFAFTLVPYLLAPIALLAEDAPGDWLDAGQPFRIAITALAIIVAAVPLGLAACNREAGSDARTSQARLGVLGGLLLAVACLLPEAVGRLTVVTGQSGFAILIVTLAALAALRALTPSPPSPGTASHRR